MARDVLIVGDTVRSSELRHEVPLTVIDSFAFAEHDGRAYVLTNSLERERITTARPDAELITVEELGLLELIEARLPRRVVDLELVSRMVARIGIRDAVVPAEMPLAVAERLRGDGVALEADPELFDLRRRVKTDAELDGIRRAQRAADAAMAAAAALLRSASPDGEDLAVAGQTLTADQVRATLRETCAAHGCPAPPDIMVTSVRSTGGHDPGTGPLPANMPIVIDLWPRDERSGCWADMTRTFVAGEISGQVAAMRDVVLDALERVRAATRPGATPSELYGAACDPIEAAGYPTVRSAEGSGVMPDSGFYFALGHGVGLDVHEDPILVDLPGPRLLVREVLAVEPGLESMPGLGGVRFEDLLLVTETGCETLTDFPYDLTP